MNQTTPDEAHHGGSGDTQLEQSRNEFLAFLGLDLSKSSAMSSVITGIVICLAGWGALSMVYQVAIYFVHPDTALLLCVLLASTAVVLVIVRLKQTSKAKSLKAEVPNAESSPSGPWTTAKPWIVLIFTLCIGVPLVRSMGTGTSADEFDRVGAGILMIGLYLAFWMLASGLERRFNRSVQDIAASPPKTDTSDWQKDWNSAPWWVIGFVLVLIALPLSGKDSSNRSRNNRIGMVPYSKDGGASRNQKRQATREYWQTAVTNLHLIRFETPSGPEAAEKYYERMFQQLRQLSDAAKRASTVNVDVDLVQMATRHLKIEDGLLQLKHQLDEYMKKEELATPTDTVDQRMALAKLLFGSAQANADVLANLPAGPVREWLEEGMRVEEQRQEQYREIEVMQAVLQERYMGTSFPLPTIDP